MVLIELSGGPCNIKNGNLNKMYEDHREFDATGAKARKVKRVLDFLFRAFPEKTPELERYSAVSLYALVSYLLETFSIQGRESEISQWFIDFETTDEGRPTFPKTKRWWTRFSSPIEKRLHTARTPLTLCNGDTSSCSIGSSNPSRTFCPRTPSERSRENNAWRSIEGTV